MQPQLRGAREHLPHDLAPAANGLERLAPKALDFDQAAVSAVDIFEQNPRSSEHVPSCHPYSLGASDQAVSGSHLDSLEEVKQQVACAPEVATQPSSPEMSLARMSSSRRDCRFVLQTLAEATRAFCDVLGAGHPDAEGARNHLRNLRGQEEELRWQQVVSWHTTSVKAASCAFEAGEIGVDQLESTVRAAHESPLGPGLFRAQVTRLRKLRLQKQQREAEAFHANELQTAAEGGDLDALVKAIDAGARSLGPSHRTVEAARVLYRQQRSSLQRNNWDHLVARHEALVDEATSRNDLHMLEACVKEASESQLGLGHPVVMDGKRRLLQMKKDQKHAFEALRQAECRHRLRQLRLEAEESIKHLRKEVARFQVEAQTR